MFPPGLGGRFATLGHSTPTAPSACVRIGRFIAHETYEEPGYHLGIHTIELCEPQGDDEAVRRKLDELSEAIGEDDDAVILAWYRREFPRCMELVPSRRHAQFVRGVKRAHEEERL